MENVLSDQNKVVSLFQFIQELNKLKQKMNLNVKDHPWHLLVSRLPDDPENVSLRYRDRVAEEDAEESDVLLSVHKPEFEICPDPDARLLRWLEPGWEDFRQEAAFIEATPSGQLDPESGEPVPERFADDAARAELGRAWMEARQAWAERQRRIARTRELFNSLYQLYFELKRESETEEMVVANGFLCDRDNPEICHPVLTHRVGIAFDPDANIISIRNTETPSELYTVVFQGMDGVNLGEINALSDDLKANDYHPLDRVETPGFLKALVRQLSADSVFSEDGAPEGWARHSRLLLYLEPCFIVRRRLDGTLKAIEQVIENIQETGEIPEPIRDIVSGGIQELPEDGGEASIEEQLAAVGGESVDILLSKQANKEQLDIARRIEQHNAVLVQGPPGTGKTHTIANLMGHFLAQGKSILVTSYTSKALRVLKDKVNPGLQNLCVSMLDDSNADMERSVNGITETMSHTTSSELRREMAVIAEEREGIIAQLADVRRSIFNMIRQECGSMDYNGEKISPSAAARFVQEHEGDLSYIPGKVRLRSPLPLTFEQLSALYRSNESLSAEDEAELGLDIPKPELLIGPADFEQAVQQAAAAQRRLSEIADKNGWDIVSREDASIEITGGFGKIALTPPSADDVRALKEQVTSLGRVERWMVRAALDGSSGGAYRQRWLTLVEQIQLVCRMNETVVAEQFGLDVSIEEPDAAAQMRTVLETVRAILAERGSIGWLTRIAHREYGEALECARINGHALETAADCDIILHQMQLDEMREKCARYWDALMYGMGMPAFYELRGETPEKTADNWIPYIRRFLDWYSSDYARILEGMRRVGLPTDVLLAVDPKDADLVAAEKQFAVIANVLPELCDVCEATARLDGCRDRLDRAKAVLLSGKRGGSRVCRRLREAVDARDRNAYAEGYAALETAYGKYALQARREDMLRTLEPVAPDWAGAIRGRAGVHGGSTLPDTIEDAWKWKQLCGMIEEITGRPFRELQERSLSLSTRYRQITALYAEKSAWYHLLRRTEANLDMNQALQGWKQTVKRIGKGTGKTAPRLKAEARRLMVKCQAAVPAWIMPINRALESLNPKQNRFDIIIIDEASQSDISALAILYMGRKLVIVGDDRQVSPMAVGVDATKMDSLEQMYLRGKIPNSQLYNAKTSLYDIAATTFKPLMLHEHFRCVPEIIGFCNRLSYDGRIKPLREASSSHLLPAVVNHRVDGGQRAGDGKVNPREAKAVVALMRACMAQPEYAGKSFGVISLLGDEQYRLIQREIDETIPPRDIIERNILCGNSANFQGDERDVIFLSLVDSGDGDKPLHLMGYGVDDATRKRYNVAVSRARDQLWVVHSLDAANDLKAGDIRRTLLEYAANPRAQEGAQPESAAEGAPFEQAVAAALIGRGYHIVQQWAVGAYRLDMVAVCAGNTVAIECDGECWHGGDAKVRADMERQTILERLGWRFIRIRGSEYYRDPAKALERVAAELERCGIAPEAAGAAPEARSSELLERVERLATEILRGGADSAVRSRPLMVAEPDRSRLMRVSN
ncbi:MAG: AAA domain-containing protein [Candidatus Spyradocola sp.]